MRTFIFLSAAALFSWAASGGYACNGGGGGGSTSTGTSGTAALRATAAMRSGSLGMSSPVSQQLALQQLAFQRLLQQESQQLATNQSNQPTTTRAAHLKQAREDTIAARKIREAALQAKRDELKAKNLAKRAATDATAQVASGQ